MKINYKLFVATLATALLFGCATHRVNRSPEPTIDPPESFLPTAQTSKPIKTQWWVEFSSPELDTLMETALIENLDIKQAWNRLAQSRAVYESSRAGLFPSFRLNGNASQTHITDDADTGTDSSKIESALLGGELSYEIDLWRRIGGLKNSAQANVAASYEEVQATAFTISGSVVDSWLSIREQVELLKLTRQQLATNKIQLELLELRLTVGEASALDILQQRQQIAATEAEIPTLLSAQQTARHQLQILLGQAPRNDFIQTDDVTLPQLPPLPSLGTPIDLLEQRPDLRAARNRLVAEDYALAVAIAERLPRLTLNLSYDFQANDIAGPFNRQIKSIIGNLTAPIFEGGRLKAEIKRRRAIVEERLNHYSQLFLNALLEVENALTQERKQGELINALQIQAGYAQDSLQEARARYLNGLNDYLPVLTALRSAQELERRIISERRLQLNFRSNLYRALGGSWSQALQTEEK
ncbi:efflux transporter outer membrane subunit [Puniceicoccaceae bacterium K14]|nr:efflux transporter outer membrane subunit [Puniceicoccaceae bacterium K14]